MMPVDYEFIMAIKLMSIVFRNLNVIIQCNVLEIVSFYYIL